MLFVSTQQTPPGPAKVTDRERHASGAVGKLRGEGNGVCVVFSTKKSVTIISRREERALLSRYVEAFRRA